MARKLTENPGDKSTECARTGGRAKKIWRNLPPSPTVFPRMKNLLTAVLLGCGLAAAAQPLPSVVLKPAYPKLTDERPVWMSEAPDGSGRLFFVYQKGKSSSSKKAPTAATPRISSTSKTATPFSRTKTAS